MSGYLKNWMRFLADDILYIVEEIWSNKFANVCNVHTFEFQTRCYMKKILLSSCLALIGYAGFSQQNIFWRTEAANGNWENGDCAEIGSENSQWWYPGFSPNQARNRPDCFDGSTSRHNLFIENNHQTTMTLNTAFWGIRSLTLSSSATSNRTFNGSPDDNTRGISLTDGIYNNGPFNVVHTFNVRIGIDAPSVNISSGVATTTIFNREVFLNDNTMVIIGFGASTFNAVISGVGGKVTKTNPGTATFTGACSYTGLTTINAGTLILNRAGGNTLPETNDITISNGILRISSNQTLNNLTNTLGIIQVDAGVTLTINGNYTGNGKIDNKGTIKIAGSTAKTFPPAGSIINNGTLNHMNNLIIDNVGGVTLGRGFTVNGNLTLANGSTTLGPNTLTINGALSSTPGNFIGSPASSIIMGGIGSFNFVQTGTSNYLKDLTLTNSAQVSLDNTLNIVGGATPGTVTLSGAGKLITNGNLVLKSDADGTARIAEVTSTDALPISGSVTVERYIPQAPLANGNNGRAWRLLSFPVTGSSAIWEAWGNGAASRVNNLDPTNIPMPTQTAGIGTLITGHTFNNATTANAARYDWWPAISGSGYTTSLRTFRPERNGGNGDWPSNVATRTMAATPLSSAAPAYMLFVRGDRTVAVGGGATTLAPRGDLRIGNVSSSVPPTSAGNFFTYGNPYASPLDFGALYDDGFNTGLIEEVMHIWDANLNGTNGLGGYRSVTRVGGIWEDNIEGNLANIQFINSGQGVLLQSATASGGTLTTKESHKVGGAPAISPFSAAPAFRERFYARLYFSNASGTSGLVDGAVAGFSEGYSLNTNDAFDYPKPLSITGNLSLGFTQSGKLLSFEGRPPVQDNDVLYLSTNGLTARAFTLEFEARDMQKPGRKAFLRDKFLGTETEIPLTGEKFKFNFEGIANNEASVATNRFEVVFKVAEEKWIVLSGKAQRPNILLNWTVPSSTLFKTYTIQQSGNNVAYKKSAVIPADANAGETIAHVLNNPGGGVKFFRVQGLTHAGETITSNEVLIGMHAGTANVAVSPNPVGSPASVSLVISNLERANYTISLLNASGIPVTTSVIRHDGKDQVYQFQLPANLAPGVYYIQVRGKGGNIVKTLMIK